jgi:hypothetical protein
MRQRKLNEGGGGENRKRCDGIGLKLRTTTALVSIAVYELDFVGVKHNWKQCSKSENPQQMK